MKYALALCLALTGCIPKIYVIDRQTVLEDEAAGEWPEFEHRLIDASAAKTPTASTRPGTSRRRARLYRVLNGEVTGETR